ncbi:MAG: response regulator [Isosphaeraceae bacterium]|nr:response regulator [Isosphaeraceae bacterium]
MTRPSALPPPFVLLVDDHECTLQRLAEIVRLAGHRCVLARSGAEALAYCVEHRPRVVVTDLVMPQLGGDILALWMRSRYPSTPLVLVTGEDLDSDRLAPLRTRFAAILPKPIDPERLLALIARWMSPPWELEA